jgi:hypothetical protein
MGFTRSTEGAEAVWPIVPVRRRPFPVERLRRSIEGQFIPGIVRVAASLVLWCLSTPPAASLRTGFE